MSFADALALAQRNDPAYLSAKANHQATIERTSIAFSALLPQVSASVNSNNNDRKYVTHSTSITPETTDQDKFKSSNARLNVTQALWRHAETIASGQAELAAQQGASQLAAAENDLFVRFTQAWFDMMLARDSFNFTIKQTEAARKLRDQTTRAAALGLASEPELEDSMARYEKALAEQAAAETDEEIKFVALEQIIGPAAKFAPPALSEDTQSIDFTNRPLAYWLDLAEKSNPSIIAATYGFDAASEEVRKQRAGHEPTVDITGSYGREEQGVGTTPLQRGYTNTQGTIGVQINIPIFSGGGQSAKVREAIALRDKAAQDLENARRGARSACKQAWFTVQAALARQAAAAQAVKSANVAMRAAELGKDRELKTELDFLQAVQQMYSALRDLRNARYEILINNIKLKAAAGQVTATDLIALSTVFAKPAPSMTPPVPAPERPKSPPVTVSRADE